MLMQSVAFLEDTIEIFDYNTLNGKLTKHDLKRIKCIALLGLVSWPELRVYMQMRMGVANGIRTIVMSVSIVMHCKEVIHDVFVHI